MAKIREARPNRASAEEAASFVNQFEELEREIATERGVFMARCKAIREQQAELLEDAKGQGVAKGLIKSIAKANELEAKAKALRDGIEDKEERQYFVDIRAALGADYSSLPLGAAAVEREDAPKQTAAQAAADAWDAASPKLN